MDVIERRAHTDQNGVLRLETSVGRADADCTVVIYVQSQAGPLSDADDPWRDVRERVAANGGERIIKVPPPGQAAPTSFEPNDLPGPPASEILIRDRR